MTEDDRDLERLVHNRLLRVSAFSFGVVTGLLGGFGLFVATNWLVLKDGGHPGPHLGLLSQYFAGYRVSFAGSFVGFAYAFVACFAAAYVGAWLYNWVADLRQGKPEAGG